MELTLMPKTGVGKFRLSSRLSEIITELQQGVDIFGDVDCILEETSQEPIYLYVKKQGNILCLLLSNEEEADD